jgi:uncharacterized protein (DUF2062 family)
MIRAHIARKALHDSYSDLTERAKIDLDFLLLTVVAAIICAFGFKMNSPSVIIGAMVISPLLYPVICVGAATYQTTGVHVHERSEHSLRDFLLPLLLQLSLTFFTRRHSDRRSSID